MEEVKPVDFIVSIASLAYYVGFILQIVFLFTPISIFYWNALVFTKLMFVAIVIYLTMKNTDFGNTLWIDIGFMCLLIYQCPKG